jgi:glycolate oxidase
MSLPRDVYKMFEDVVGPENITDREFILAAYRQELPILGPEKLATPEAVILPGSTREIQSLVKICNRYDIKYTVCVTGLLSTNFANEPGMVILHLKRMNKILEINEKDRYAVVEPGVTHVQLLPEVMKLGLIYTVPSCGCQCSVLANFTSTWGENFWEHSRSMNRRHLLGAEWVLPPGDIIKMGSLGVNAGWFCPDGPGPSLRGLARGYMGVLGGLGVFTKGAVKLFEWQGDKVLQVDGRTPAYAARLPKDRFKFMLFAFPTLDALGNAMLELGKAQVGAAVCKHFNATMALGGTTSADEFWDVWAMDYMRNEAQRVLDVLIATWSQEELEYEEAVVREIVKEFGGVDVPPPVLAAAQDAFDAFVTCSVTNRVARLGGAWTSVKLGTDSVDQMVSVAKTIPGDFRDEFIQRGLTVDGPDNVWIVSIEYAHMAHMEHMIMYDDREPDWREIPIAYAERSAQSDFKHGFHATFVCGDETNRLFGPHLSNEHLWAMKIKSAFDPKLVSNPRAYIIPDK